MGDVSKTLPLERSSVQSAHELIKLFIYETPVLTCKTLNALASTPQTPEALVGTPFEGQEPARPKINFFFKCENYQRIGAFKARGAFHALASLSDEELKNGVVTSSSGNHAQALALAARTRGVPAYIVMPTISTPSKIAATKGYGAEVIFSGSTSQEREAVMQDVMKRTGARYVPAYDDPNIILGQGTMALELEKQVKEMVELNPELSVHSPNNKHRPTPQTNGTDTFDTPRPRPRPRPGHLDAIIAPCGGGGMLSGVATAQHNTGGPLIFGAEPSFENANDAQRSLLTGSRIPSVSSLTIADGLRTPLGEIPWSIIRDKSKVAGVYAVSEEQILGAMRLVLERMKVVVEPSAVVGLAVALWDEGWRSLVGQGRGRVGMEGSKEEEEEEEEGWDVGVVLSGGNTTVEAMVGMFGAEKEKEKEKERGMGKVGIDGAKVVENVPG